MGKFQNSVRSQDEYVEVEFKLWTERRTVLYLWKTKKTTWHIFECEGSTVKGLTLERYKQMIGKEGRKTDDMNSVSQSAEIVRKKME